MMLTFSKLKSRFEAWDPNPVLLKELRQGVQSLFLLAAFYFLLLLFFSISLYVLINQSLSEMPNGEIGKTFFSYCLGAQIIGCIFLIPLYTGIRVACERHQSDLMYYTPMPVTKLVQGKILSSLYLVGLLYCVCLPFMLFGTLLDGVDWLTILFVSGVVLFATFAAIQASMAVAVLPVPLGIKTILGLLMAAALALFGFFLFFGLTSIAAEGASPIILKRDFLFNVMTTLFFSAFPLMFCYLFSLSNIVPLRNKNYLVRNNVQLNQANG